MTYNLLHMILSLKKESAEAMGDMKGGAGTGNALAAGLNKLASQTILENVRVLALNSNTESIAPAADPKESAGDKRNTPDRARRAEYHTITLEVSPEGGVRVLWSLLQTGKIQLQQVREYLSWRHVDAGEFPLWPFYPLLIRSQLIAARLII